MPKDKVKDKVEVIAELVHGLEDEKSDILQLREGIGGMFSRDGKRLLLWKRTVVRCFDVDGRALRAGGKHNGKGVSRCGFVDDEPVVLYDNGDLVRLGGRTIAKGLLDISFEGETPRQLVKKRGGVLTCMESKRELWSVELEGGFVSAAFAADGTACAVAFDSSDSVAVLDADTGEEIGEIYDNPNDGYELLSRHVYLESSATWTTMDGRELEAQPSQLVATSRSALLGVDLNITGGEAKTLVFDAEGKLRATYPSWLQPVAFLDAQRALAVTTRFKEGEGAPFERTDLFRVALDRKEQTALGSLDVQVHDLFAHGAGRVVAAGAESLYLLDCVG